MRNRGKGRQRWVSSARHFYMDFTRIRIFSPSLKGNSPVRGNVCEADKRVPVSGGKGGARKGDGRVYLFHLYTLRCFYVDFPREVFLAVPEREGGSRQADGRVRARAA